MIEDFEYHQGMKCPNCGEAKLEEEKREDDLFLICPICGVEYEHYYSDGTRKKYPLLLEAWEVLMIYLALDLWIADIEEHAPAAWKEEDIPRLKCIKKKFYRAIPNNIDRLYSKLAHK